MVTLDPTATLLLFDVGGMEFVVILFVALMLFGGKLPDVARTLGKTIGDFKRQAARFSEEMQDVTQERSPRKPLRPPAPPSGKPIARGPTAPVQIDSGSSGGAPPAKDAPAPKTEEPPAPPSPS